MTGYKMTTDQASCSEVLGLLAVCDVDFSPKLSERVVLEEYASKLCVRARRFECWSATDDLVGLVAVYCNSPDKAVAFITNVSVTTPYRGQGIARQLLQNAIAAAFDEGYADIALQVGQDAVDAIELYKSMGFYDTGVKDGILNMVLTR